MDELLKESLIEACEYYGFSSCSDSIIKLLEKKILGELSQRETLTKLEDIYQAMVEN